MSSAPHPLHFNAFSLRPYPLCCLLENRDQSAAGVLCAGEVFDGTPRKRSKLETDAAAAVAASWASLPSDILGVVMGFLPCFADRTSVTTVCRHWRSAGRSHVLHDGHLHPPLQLLVLPRFRFWCSCSGVTKRAAWRVQMPPWVAADDVRCVGSFQGWLVGVAPIRGHGACYRGFDGECFMVNAFSQEVVRLPCLSTSSHGLSGYSRKALPVDNGFGEVYFTTNDKYAMSLRKVVLSASPEPGSKCIVAASSFHGVTHTLALWQPGMKSWHVCDGLPIVGPKDLAFYQGKLFVLLRFMARLYAFELDEDDCGVVVSRVVEHSVIEALGDHRIQQIGALTCNIVVWRGNLLVIVRRYDITEIRFSPPGRTLRQVQVFVLDLSRNPCGLTEIHSVDGDCVFVDSCGCKSFPAGLYDGVEGDHIYFVDQYSKYESGYFNPSYDTFVYNVRDGTTRPFATELAPNNFGEPNGKLDVPLWLLTSK